MALELSVDVARGAVAGASAVRSREATWTLAAIGLLALASLIPVWAVGVLPLQDLPNHLLKVHVIERYLSGDPEVTSLYALNWRPVSNLTWYAFALVAVPALGDAVASKVFVSLYLIGLPLAGFAFLRTTNPRNLPLGLAVSGITYSLFLAKGNLNFCLSLALYLLALRELVRPAASERNAILRMTGLATLLYFTHGFAFLTLCGVTAIRVLLDRGRVSARALGLLPGLVLFAALLIAQAASSTGTRGLEPLFSFPGLYIFEEIPRWLFDTDGWLDAPEPMLWLVSAAVVAASTLAGVAGGTRGVTFPRWLRRHWLLLASLALGCGYVLAPMHLADWGHLKVRLIPLTVLTALGAMTLPRWAPARAVVCGGFVVAAVLGLARTSAVYEERAASVEVYTSGLAAVEANASVLPIDKDGDVGKVRFNLHSWAYYHVAKGGWGPYLHAHGWYDPVVFRVPPWAPAEDLRGQVIDAEIFARASGCYDFILLWGADGADVANMSRYFDVVHRSGKLLIGRNRNGVSRKTPTSADACSRMRS